MSLYRHQIEGAAYLLDHPGAMLWWDVRSGKTRAALVAGRQMLQGHHGLTQPRATQIVAVTPAVGRGVWAAEWEAIGGDPDKVARLYGRVNRRIEGELKTAELVVVGWDVLKSWTSYLRYGHPVLILDESHDHLANPKADRYYAAGALEAPAASVWLLSGTPYRSSAMDLYHQVRILGHRSRFMGASDFGKRFCFKRPNHFTRTGWEWWGLKNEGDLLQQFPVHRVRESGVMGSRRVTWLEEGILPFNPGDARSISQARLHLARIKAQRTIQLLSSQITERPVVIFGWHHEYLDTVAAALRAPKLDGNSSERQRTELIRDFRAGKLNVLVCQMKAAGVSIDLASSQIAVFGELDWNETTHRQAEGRLRGPNQKGHPIYHYLVCRNSIDDYTWSVRMDKGRAMDRLDKAAS